MQAAALTITIHVRSVVKADAILQPREMMKLLTLDPTNQHF
jgi:hypothetical protein